MYLQRGLKSFYRMGLTLHVVKTALSAGLSWLVSSYLSSNQYPYFAALGAILTIQVTVVDSIQKAIQRVVGIIGGVMVSIIIGHWLPLGAISITLVVLVGMALSTALRMNPQITSQVAVSSLLVLAFGSTHGYAVSRIIETIIGCAIAVLVNTVVVPPNPIPQAEQRIFDLSQEASTVLRHLAFAYREQSLRPVDLPYVQQLVDKTEKTFEAVKLAQQSLRYSPLLRNRRSRFILLSQTVNRFEHITIEIRGIARGLVDLGPDIPPFEHIINAMNATASCVHLFAEATVASSDDVVQALQVSIEEAGLRQNQCLMELKNLSSPPILRDIGGILTDLNRILVEVSGGTLVVTGREFVFRTGEK